MAIEEYRFEVRLGWDRGQHFLVLSGGTLAAGAGLMRIGVANAQTPWVLQVPTALVFLFGAGVSIIGIQALRKGHEYYRMTVYKKTLIESLLGLTNQVPTHSDPFATLAITTTRGMTTVDEILQGGSKWVSKSGLRPGTVMFSIQAILAMFATLHFACALIALWDVLVPAAVKCVIRAVLCS